MDVLSSEWLFNEHAHSRMSHVSLIEGTTQASVWDTAIQPHNHRIPLRAITRELRISVTIPLKPQLLI